MLRRLLLVLTFLFASLSTAHVSFVGIAPKVASITFGEARGQSGILGAQGVPSSAPYILNLNFANANYHWDGPTTLDSAVTTARDDDQIATSQNASGTWNGHLPNTTRVAVGKGLLVEVQSSNRLKWNRVFNNAVWTLANATLTDAGDNPIVGSQPATILSVPVGTTSVDIPPNTTIKVYAVGHGGGGADGVTNTRGGGGGGGGALAIATFVTGSCSSITVAVPAAGTGAPTLAKNCAGVDQVVADYGRDASGATAGTAGQSTNSTGTTKRSGGNGGGGSSGTGNRGGGGGGGAPNDTSLGGTNNNGRTGASGNNQGGGGGGSVGGGVTTAGAASAGVGGTGGTNLSDTGGGTGGTAGVLAGAGSEGGGGGGGLSGTGINGGAGSYFTWTVSQGTFSDTAQGGGGGGGGGGFAGNGGVGGLGAGGGGGGSTAVAAGTGSAGGDAVMVITYGASNATRFTATSANATLRQAVTASSFQTTPSILMRPQTVTGPIYLSADDCVTKTDISSQLISGRYQQVFAPYQTLSNPTWCMEVANDNDEIDIDLAQLESQPHPTTPIPTTTATALRHVDLVTLNLGSYSAFVTNDAVTILLTVWPGRAGTSVPSEAATDLAGWSVLDMGGTGTQNAEFTASIDDCTPSCGAGGAGTTMDVTAIASGAISVNSPIPSTVGVDPDTIVTAQLTGSDGGVGTYRVSVSQTVTSQTIIQMACQFYRMNATVKPVTFRQNVGVTVCNGNAGTNYGFDPQTAEYTYFAWNRFGYSTKATTDSGIVSLKGDNEDSTPHGTWATPSVFDSIYLGSQRPVGGNPIQGYISELIILPTNWPGSSLSGWTGLATPCRRPSNDNRRDSRRPTRRVRRLAA